MAALLNPKISLKVMEAILRQNSRKGLPASTTNLSRSDIRKIKDDPDSPMYIIGDCVYLKGVAYPK